MLKLIQKFVPVKFITVQSDPLCNVWLNGKLVSNIAVAALVPNQEGKQGIGFVDMLEIEENVDRFVSSTKHINFKLNKETGSLVVKRKYGLTMWKAFN